MGWVSMFLAPNFPGPEAKKSNPAWDAFVINGITIIASTQKAYLIRQGQYEHWLPSSHIKIIQDGKAIKLPRWLFEKTLYNGGLANIQLGSS